MLSGIWERRTYLESKLVNEMLRRFLERSTAQPCIIGNWDLAIHRCLYIALHSALGCLVGELASNCYFPTQYLRIEDIQIVQETEAMASIYLKITLKWCKGQRNDRNVDQMHFLAANLDEESQWSSPVTLLLVHCARHALVKRDGGKYAWTHPSRPALPNLNSSGFPDSDTSMTTKQAQQALALLAKASEFQARPNSQAEPTHYISDSVSAEATNSVHFPYCRSCFVKRSIMLQPIIDTEVLSKFNA